MLFFFIRYNFTILYHFILASLKTSIIVYSYLMGVQAIDQNIFPEVLGKTKVFYCPRSMTEGNWIVWSIACTPINLIK